MINRLRDVMTSVFPALEREFDYSSCKGALVLLTGYASPERLRRLGETRLARWLRTARCAAMPAVAARASPPPSAVRSRCPARTSPPASSPSSPPTSWPSISASNDLDAQIAARSINIPKPKSSSPCPDSAPSSAPPCSSPPVICGLPQRRSPRRRRRARPGPQRLGPANRQPAQAPSLQPPAAARVLPISADQHDARRAQP